MLSGVAPPQHARRPRRRVCEGLILRCMMLETNSYILRCFRALGSRIRFHKNVARLAGQLHHEWRHQSGTMLPMGVQDVAVRPSLANRDITATNPRRPRVYFP